jgi:hypothetical protein
MIVIIPLIFLRSSLRDKFCLVSDFWCFFYELSSFSESSLIAFFYLLFLFPKLIRFRFILNLFYCSFMIFSNSNSFYSSCFILFEKCLVPPSCIPCSNPLFSPTTWMLFSIWWFSKPWNWWLPWFSFPEKGILMIFCSFYFPG